VIATTLAAYLYRSGGNLSPWYQVPANLLAYGLFALQSVMIIYIHNRYYPAGDMPRAVFIVYRITDVISIILVLLCVAIVIANIFFPDFSGTAKYPRIRYGEIILCSLVGIALIIQIIAGEKMVRFIRKNARKQLEDSFV
jgi:hypothetical protein